MNDKLNTSHQHDDEIDLMQLVGSLWDGRWIVLATILLFTVAGIVYALAQTPIYEANSLIQIEEKHAGLPGMPDLQGLLGSTSSSTAQIELIKSRRVLGQVVDNLSLDISVSPKYAPLIGKAMARRYAGAPGELAEPLPFLSDAYAWGGEEIEINRFDVPDRMQGQAHTLVAAHEGWVLLNGEQNEVLRGKTNKPAKTNGYALMVTQLKARPGTEFTVTKQRHYTAIKDLTSSISASEKGQDSGIIALTYEHPNPYLAEDILNETGRNYVRQNVERSSAEAAQSLEFLRNKLPEVKRDLESAEEKLNSYQVTAETIDITAEGGALLEQIVSLETRISEMEIQRAEIEQRFQSTHPRYKAWAGQMQELKQRRAALDTRIGDLPEKQQELVRMRRDLEVGNEIYLQMLGNIQQLDIARAGTVGNVRVVDEAAANVVQPVRPKKSLIVALAFMLGGMLGVAIVLIKHMFNRGVENPEEIEKLGLPVYASVPKSDTQEALGRKIRASKLNKKGMKSRLLAIENPADLGVEALRSLRTSLHFGMMDAKNNLLMISGPSPGVGKTFISANLAAVMALADKKVLLIDADMRKGFTHEVFGTDNKQGLSNILAGSVAWQQAVHQTQVPNLSFVSRGTIPPNPSELLMSKHFDDFVQSVIPEYDLVIIDTPPVLAVTDAAIIGKQAGTTMLVARFGVNPIKEIELCHRRFEQNGVDVKGVVFNAVVKKASAYGYGGYYNYEYTSEKA